MKVERWQLQQRQAYPLDLKVGLSLRAIVNWYEHWNGEVYVSFSGGKDSTVLLHLVRSIYPQVKAVFVDTGLEYPEIRSFVKNFSNVEWLRPKMKFNEVIEKYGFPIVGKEVSKKISEIRNTKSDYLRNKRLNGDTNGNGMLGNKWRFLVDAPFKISDYCCSVLKKSPLKSYNNKAKCVPYIGTMASDSWMRKEHYINYGCNIFNTTAPQSNPLGFWMEADIWEYIKLHNISYSPIYDMGYARTGCMFCMFGVHLEKSPNRFQRMQIHHPKLWDYCINTLNLRQPLDYIGVKYEAERLPILDYIEKER